MGSLSGWGDLSKCLFRRRTCARLCRYCPVPQKFWGPPPIGNQVAGCRSFMAALKPVAELRTRNRGGSSADAGDAPAYRPPVPPAFCVVVPDFESPTLLLSPGTVARPVSPGMADPGVGALDVPSWARSPVGGGTACVCARAPAAGIMANDQAKTIDR